MVFALLTASSCFVDCLGLVTACALASLSGILILLAGCRVSSPLSIILVPISFEFGGLSAAVAPHSTGGVLVTLLTIHILSFRDREKIGSGEGTEERRVPPTRLSMGKPAGPDKKSIRNLQMQILLDVDRDFGKF
ncbi:hypothetical protein K435DRAFT_791963 [Dendrothele bispora CBS 962.96]|uniref:Uncharacterized protein n=1 Tax=Dendrothele bispora (strain CBS 962.96) TaxID=1314807 RepID=A0A4V4HHL9_DENBC|nr:hypothetical protein K435DRAFT_791963 [Dendrothele bispora CBS 962.96]